MSAFYVIFGIILFIVLIFSFKLSFVIEMTDKNVVKVKYLFLKFTILDSSKPEKEKKKKTKKSKTDKNTEKDTQNATDESENTQTKQGGNNLFKQLYIEQGYDGIEKMLLAVKNSLGSFFSKLYKTITINELYLTMHITGSDAADTAIKYGNLAAWLFPVMGKIASTCKMKKYDLDISPSFLGVKNEADLYLDISVVPLRITNALVVLAVQLLFKVLFKVLFANSKAKKSVNIKNSATLNNEQSAESVKSE